jgi:hypothetical protein
MIRLLFVGDGPRDKASLPPLVSTILANEVECEFRAWKEIRQHRGRGYHRKLLYALALARDSRMPGVVAVVDADTQPIRQRLRELQDARKKDRASNPPLPTSLGEARPNVDAWLLDDATAVREVLDLSSDAEIPSVRSVRDPKDSLNEVITQARRAGASVERDLSTLPFLSKIAIRVSPQRCANAKTTGFEAFQKDIVEELGCLTEK